MENCTSTSIIGNKTICYVNINDSGCIGGSSLRHDTFIAAWAAVVTCAAIAAYNFYIDYKVSIMKRKKKEEEEDELLDEKDDIWRNTYGTMAVLHPSHDNSIMSSKNAIAASLAHNIEGMEASGNFISAVLSQMWNHMNIAVSNAVKDALEPTLKELKPVSLHFVQLDLGDVPIKTQNMFIHRVDLECNIGDRIEKQAGIQIDVDVVWDGNCDIMLQATMSQSAKVTFGVKKIKLSGRMHILLSPLTTELPIISAVQYGFTNPPDLQLSFSGAVKVLNKLHIVQSVLPSVIQSALAGVLVLPQRLVMPVDMGTYDFLDTYQPPKGMVRITVVEGRGFRVLRKHLLSDIPDVYCEIALGASEKFKTSTQYDNLSPSWKESCDFILYDMDQKIYVQAFDKDKIALDPDELGKAEISVRDLFKKGGAIELELELDDDKTGCFIRVSSELFHLSDQLHSLSSPIYAGENNLSGLVTIIVTKAFDIPIRKEDAATCVKVVYGEGSDHERTFCTGIVMDYPGCDALNPMYDCVFHVPITVAMMVDSGGKKAGDKNSITFKLIDGEGANGSRGRGELGKIMVTHETLRKACRRTVTKTSPIGNEGAKLEYMISLSGMLSEEEFVKGSTTPHGGHALKPTESLYGGMEVGEGVDIRVTAVHGRGFQARERRFGRNDDVPDVYCKIRLKSFEQESPWWKTDTVKDDAMPRWNESKEFQNVNSPRSTIIVGVYDENRIGKDDYLGSAEFSVEQLLRKRLGLMEVQLEDESSSAPTKMYVTLKCIELESFGRRASDHGVNAIGSDEEVLVHYHPNIGDEGFEATLLEETPLHESTTPQATSASKPPEPLHDKIALSKDVDIRVTAVQGRGFQVRKRRFGKKDDIPDVYLKIRMNSFNKEEFWKTATIKDNTTPQWNEYKDFRRVNRGKATIHVDAYEDNRIKDDYIGGANFPVEQLMQKGTWEVELQNESTLTKTWVTLRCTCID